jgi:hypothetical protein
MKKFIFIGAMSSLLMHFISCVSIASPIKSPNIKTIINTTTGQELIDLQQALDSGAITQAEYDELKMKIMQRLDAPVDSTGASNLCMIFIFNSSYSA